MYQSILCQEITVYGRPSGSIECVQRGNDDVLPVSDVEAVEGTV